MTQPSSNYLRCEGREIHYMDWGTDNAEIGRAHV